MKRKIALAALIIVLVLSLIMAACQGAHTATFVANGGTDVEAVKTDVVESAPSTTREGYTFIGWYLTEDFSDSGITYPYKLSEDTTFYAKWQKNEAPKFIVNFALNNGNVMSAVFVSQLDEAPDVTREGYTLDGWYDNQEFDGEPIVFPYAVTKLTTLYAKWTKNEAEKFLVNFETNGGSSIRAVVCSAIETLPATTREGYRFDGWYEDEDLSGNAIAFPYEVTKETVLYAKWTEIEAEKFLVNFETNGGSNVRAAMYSVIESSPETTRDGYVFGGWYDNEDLNGSAVTFPYAVKKETVLYAKWTEKRPDTFTVTFNSNGGSAVSAQQTTTVATEPIPTRSGNYLFEGWFEQSDFSGTRVTFPYTVTADTTLYAKWSQTGFTLSFETDGGTALADRANQLVVKESDIGTTTKTGMVFAGWYLDEECENAVSFPYTLTQATTFYAKWDDQPAINFTIHFVNGGNELNVSINGGAPIKTTLDTTSSFDLYRNKPYITAVDGSLITITSPTRDNAEFKGWYTVENPEDETTKVTFPFKLDGNRVFYAQWIVNVEPNPEDIAILNEYLGNNNPTAYIAGYGLLIKNSAGTIDQTFTQYYYSPDKVIAYEYAWDANAQGGQSANGAWVPAYLDFAFKRTDNDTYWMTYTDTGNNSGKYQFQGLWYNAESLTDIEQGFRMVYLNNLSHLDASAFYRYDGKWYATEDYVNEAGHLLLGNASGNPLIYEITYTELALTFDANGKLTDIDVKSSVNDSYSYGTGIAVTRYYYTHDISIWATDPATDPNSLLNIDESQFLQDQTRPNGLYPELNPEDTNRNNVTSDGVEYTTAQLQSALSELTEFTAYYTLAGRTFTEFTYIPVTLTVNGNYGTVKHNAYDPYTWGEFTSAAQTELDNWYFKFDQNAFFLAISGSNGYSVYCDQYSYKNNYYYNQYLLGTQAAINFNPKYPVGLRYLNASNFTYNAEGGYFEFNGDADAMKQVGQMLFGDMDYAYPEEGETETYVYIRLYMNDSKLVKVVAATDLELYGESHEYFIKEVVLTSYASQTVSLPAGIEAQCIIPGEELVGGSVAGLQSAISATKNTNHKYKDIFAYDDDDELGGVGYYGTEGDKYDLYTHINGVTQVNTKLFIYFKNGKMYQQYVTDGGTAIEEVDISAYPNKNASSPYKYDVEKVNSYILWAYSMADLLDANWFYQGKDGNYYGKAEYMNKLSWAIGRYSGCEQFLEPNANSSYFSDGYRWSVTLDYVSVSVYGGKLESIYYSGSILVKGSAGQHTKPFSGYATFLYDATSINLPVSDTPQATRPAVYQYINASYDFYVNNSGILHITDVPNATGYKAYVYSLTTDDLIAEFAASDGMDLKTVAALNVGSDIKKYRIAIKALGNGSTYLDGLQSGTVAIELSTLPKQETPTVTLNHKTATITVSGEYSADTYYHYAVLQGTTTVAQGNKAIATSLDLNNLGVVTLNPVTTYQIEVYIMGENGVIRDSQAVKLYYTTPKADGSSYLNDLFDAIDYTKSFSVSLSAQDRYRYHYFTQTYDGIQLMDASKSWLDANREYTMEMSMYFEASLNQGKLTFYLADPGKSYKHLYDVTFRFNKIGNTLVGQYQGSVNGEVTTSKTLTTGLLFAGIADFADDFTELYGDIHQWPNLAHRYTGDITSAQTQAAIRNLTILDEIFDKQLTYTAMQLNMGYDSKGALSSNSCSLALAADTEDGHSLIVSFCFSRFGENLSRWVKD